MSPYEPSRPPFILRLLTISSLALFFTVSLWVPLVVEWLR